MQGRVEIEEQDERGYAEKSEVRKRHQKMKDSGKIGPFLRPREARSKRPPFFAELKGSLGPAESLPKNRRQITGNQTIRANWRMEKCSNPSGWILCSVIMSSVTVDSSN